MQQQNIRVQERMCQEDLRVEQKKENLVPI